jgi:hypothetical protein
MNFDENLIRALFECWVQIRRQGQLREASGGGAAARRGRKSRLQPEARAQGQELARRHQHQTWRTRLLVSHLSTTLTQLKIAFSPIQHKSLVFFY